MRTKALVLTLALAVILGLGCVSLVSRTTGSRVVTEEGSVSGRAVGPQHIAIIVGDVQLFLAADTFQMPFDSLF